MNSFPSKKINILYLRDTDKVCGPGKTMINTHRTLDRNRFSLVLCVTGSGEDGKNAFCESARSAGADVVHFQTGGFFGLSAVLRLIKMIKVRQIDILQTHDAQTRRIGIIAARLAGIPHISSVHGWIRNSRKQRLGVVLDKLLIRFSEKVIVMSELMKKEIVSAGVPVSKVMVLHNAILLDDYRSECEATKIRNEFNIAHDEKLIAIVGRLSPEKRHDLFLEAASHLITNHQKIKFLIVGDGPLLSELQKRVADRNLEDHVIFTGHRTDVPNIYLTIDILVICSDTEGSPNVLLEAFASGKPVVATKVGGIPEMMTHMENGLLIEPGNAKEMIQSIDLLMNTSGLAAEMGRNGRKTIEENFSFSKRTSRIEELYAALSVSNQYDREK